VAGHGLSPSLQRLIDRPLVDSAWEPFVNDLDRAMLSTFALEASRTGALPVTEEQAEDLRLRAAAATGRAEDLLRSLGDIVDALDALAVSTRVLHGAATSALDYPLPVRRLFQVGYVLVAPELHAEAVARLESAGVVRRADEVSRRSRRAPGWHLTPSGTPVAVIKELSFGPFGASVDVDELFLSRVPMGRGNMQALGAEERLIVACAHARFDRAISNLLVQRDVVQLVLRLNLSLQKLERLAVSWRVEAVLADVVRRAWETFAVPDAVPISEWSRSYRPRRRVRQILAAHPLPITMYVDRIRGEAQRSTRPARLDLKSSGLPSHEFFVG
jgi:hypothetical protein